MLGVLTQWKLANATNQSLCVFGVIKDFIFSEMFNITGTPLPYTSFETLSLTEAIVYSQVLAQLERSFNKRSPNLLWSWPQPDPRITLKNQKYPCSWGTNVLFEVTNDIKNQSSNAISAPSNKSWCLLSTYYLLGTVLSTWRV